MKEEDNVHFTLVNHMDPNPDPSFNDDDDAIFVFDIERVQEESFECYLILSGV